MAEAAGSSPIQKQLDQLNKDRADWMRMLDAAQNEEDTVFARERLAAIDRMRLTLLTGRVDMVNHGPWCALHAQLHVVQTCRPWSGAR